MKIGSWLKPNVEYGRDLLESSLKGANTAWKSGQHDISASAVAKAAGDSWKPAVVGIAVGTITAYLVRKRRLGRAAVLAGIAGGAIGLSGALAWNHRNTIQAVAEGAKKEIDRTNDARWLRHNPVDYA